MGELEIVQWFFDLEPVARGFNWPVSADRMVQAKRNVDQLVAAKSTADDVLTGYKIFAGAVGPTVMTALLMSDDAFPEVNHSGKPTPPANGKITLYVDKDGKRVLVQTSKEWGQAPQFSVE